MEEADPYKATAYPLTDYPEVEEVDVNFPRDIGIAYAVCGNSCGRSEFIVDGSTQVCQYCGRLMFRTEVRMYVLAPKSKTKAKRRSPKKTRS